MDKLHFDRTDYSVVVKNRAPPPSSELSSPSLKIMASAVLLESLEWDARTFIAAEHPSQLRWGEPVEQESELAGGW
jgi:hypothetical protein